MYFSFLLKIFPGCSAFDDLLQCNPWCDGKGNCQNILNHTNIQILKQNFTLKRIAIYRSNITVLQKVSKILLKKK